MTQITDKPGPAAMPNMAQISDQEFLRYSRQVLLPEVGESGQSELKQSHVVIVGVGGLGHLAAQYIAAAGIGRLTLIDGDIIELSNLPRQCLFSDADIGQHKAIIAKDKLAKAYVDCDIRAINQKLTDNSASELVSEILNTESHPSTIVLDCTDNFETRQLVNRLCVTHALPLVSASAAHFQGQLLTVDIKNAPESGCYQCLFPQEMQVKQSCQTVGVLGPMVGVMASMQALVAMQILLGAHPISGKLLRFNGHDCSWRQATLRRADNCAVCSQA